MFIDSYAKDGLRGIALSKSIQTSDKSIAHQNGNNLYMSLACECFR